MKYNHSDLLHIAQLHGITCPSDATPEEIIGYLKAGEGPPRPFHDPERELRATMMSWVEDHWAVVLAQHIGELDCIACPAGRIASCFLANRNQLQLEGRVKTEDPWLLTSSTATRDQS